MSGLPSSGTRGTVRQVTVVRPEGSAPWVLATADLEDGSVVVGVLRAPQSRSRKGLGVVVDLVEDELGETSVELRPA